MKEYKVGEQITLAVKENIFNDPNHPCKGCFFFGVCYSRSDGKNVIFVEKGK